MCFYESILRIVKAKKRAGSSDRKTFSQETKCIAAGSSLKICRVAEGKADCFPRLASTMEWDTVAGHAICAAVGIEVVNVRTQEVLSYNKPHLLNPDFVVNPLFSCFEHR